jgi:hypothetical protein
VQDLFDLKLQLSPDPSPLGVVVHTNSTSGLSRPIAAQQSLQFGFLGTKGGGAEARGTAEDGSGAAGVWPRRAG